MRTESSTYNFYASDDEKIFYNSLLAAYVSNLNSFMLGRYFQFWCHKIHLRHIGCLAWHFYAMTLGE